MARGTGICARSGSASSVPATFSRPNTPKATIKNERLEKSTCMVACRTMNTSAAPSAGSRGEGSLLLRPFQNSHADDARMPTNRARPATPVSIRHWTKWLWAYFVS